MKNFIFFIAFIFALNISFGQSVTITPNLSGNLKLKRDGIGLDHSDATGVVRIGTFANIAYGGILQTHSNHALSFATNNNTPQMTLLTTGQLAIGTSNVATNELVQINGRLRLMRNAFSSGLWFNNSANGTALTDGAFLGMNNETSGSESLGIWLNGAFRFTVDRTGNTTQNSVTAQTASANYGLLHTTGTVSVGTYINNATGGGFGTKTNHSLNFFTNNGAYQATLLTNGNFGIGTTTPIARLAVASDVSLGDFTSLASFTQANSTNSGTVLNVTSNGTGNVANFSNTNSANNQPALAITTNAAGGTAVSVISTGTSSAGNFNVNNAASSANALLASSDGTTHTLNVANTGTGQAAIFQLTNAASTANAIIVTQNGTGNCFQVFYQGGGTSTTTARNFVTFSNGGNVARIDNTGKGFFNGGTQSSGADVAESFGVEGNRDTYEAGDVLVISESSDRTVMKSSQPYSTLVAGVFATKPGVLLTPENIDTDLSQQVPMGVIGVIPTKVCNEGGNIKRGDLLVTSSKTGYAMKADRKKLEIGQAIGKALQDFEGETGKIEVLVNIR